MAHLHDSGYKYLFSHAELVQELLEAFAPPGVSALLDFAPGKRQLRHPGDEAARG